MVRGRMFKIFVGYWSICSFQIHVNNFHQIDESFQRDDWDGLVCKLKFSENSSNFQKSKSGQFRLTIDGVALYVDNMSLIMGLSLNSI